MLVFVFTISRMPDPVKKTYCFNGVQAIYEFYFF